MDWAPANRDDERDMNLRNEGSNETAVTAPAKRIVVRSITGPAAVTDHYRRGTGIFRKLTAPATVLALLATSTAIGQEAVSKNRVSVSYRAGWNIKGTFSGIGGSARQNDPGPPVGGVNHEYDDGYVRVDSTNSGLDLTWNWGFDSPSQINGDNLEMRSSHVLEGKSSQDEFQHGFEVTFGRELGAIGKARWGAEGAFNYLYVGLKDRGSQSMTLVTTVDTYALEGVDPFNPPGSQTPNRGTFTGPAPLIPDAPASRREEVTPGGAMASGERQLNA